MTSSRGFRASSLPPTRENVAVSIAANESEWQTPENPLDLSEGLRWLPDLEARSTGAVLHVQLTRELPDFIGERLALAAKIGRSVHVALPVEALWNVKAISRLSEIDAIVHVLDGEFNPAKPQPLLTSLGKAEIRLPSEVRKQIGLAALNRCQGARTSDEKGWRLESLLVYLLSQGQELKVVESRLRTETEEIDIVAQPRVAGLARCWVLPGAPFVLVEAKNWSRPVGKPQVSDLLTKLRGYRQTAKVGVLVGAAGFTEDAKKQELRFASEEGTIVFVGPGDLKAWIEVDDLDEHFEGIVRRAMLR